MAQASLHLQPKHHSDFHRGATSKQVLDPDSVTWCTPNVEGDITASCNSFRPGELGRLCRGRWHSRNALCGHVRGATVAPELKGFFCDKKVTISGVLSRF